MLRFAGALTIAFVAAANAGTLGAGEPLLQATDTRSAALGAKPPPTYRAAVFVTL